MHSDGGGFYAGVSVTEILRIVLKGIKGNYAEWPGLESISTTMPRHY